MTELQESSFLQSKYWQSFQEVLGHQTFYLNGEGYSCRLIKKSNRLGDYLLAPYGPTVDNVSSLKICLDAIKQTGKNAGANWVRIEPVCRPIEKNEAIEIIKAAGAIKAARNFNPGNTRIIDLKLSVEELFDQLSSTNRALIRRNEKEKAISFSTSSDPADIALFSEMIKTVESRNKVHFYSSEYYTKQAEVLMPAGVMFLELAHYQSKAVASTIIHQYKSTASYTYAASLPEARDKNASALLAWQAIKNAKARGATRFDFFGVAPADAPANHPWQGFSAFKAKFGGKVEDLLGTWDIPINSRYRIYQLAKKIK